MYEGFGAQEVFKNALGGWGFILTEYVPVADPIRGHHDGSWTQDVCCVETSADDMRCAETQDTCCAETQNRCCAEAQDRCCAETQTA